MHHPWFPTRKASKLTFVCFQLQLFSLCIVFNNWSWKFWELQKKPILSQDFSNLYILRKLTKFSRIFIFRFFEVSIEFNDYFAPLKHSLVWNITIQLTLIFLSLPSIEKITFTFYISLWQQPGASDQETILFLSEPEIYLN